MNLLLKNNEAILKGSLDWSWWSSTSSSSTSSSSTSSSSTSSSSTLSLFRSWRERRKKFWREVWKDQAEEWLRGHGDENNADDEDDDDSNADDDDDDDDDKNDDNDDDDDAGDEESVFLNSFL